MNNKDTITKTYMSNNAVFADAFNFYVYAGEQVIKHDDLRELDTTEAAVILTENDSGSAKPDAAEQRYRDVLRSAVFKSYNDTIYAVLGIENQSDIHYAMPVRCFVYDVDAARVINIMTKTHIDIPDDAKEVNMCKAIEDLINDSKAEGRLEGRLEGRNEGIAEGIVKGRIEGINMGKVDLMSELVEYSGVKSITCPA